MGLLCGDAAEIHPWACFFGRAPSSHHVSCKACEVCFLCYQLGYESKSEERGEQMQSVFGHEEIVSKLQCTSQQ
jgi:hypothetical protein